MEVFLTVLKYLAGPVLGGIIGYFTNWLAVKMLFHPYYPVKIGKHTLPFTPGIIPRQQGQLAKAVGRAVGEELLTADDVSTALCSEETKGKIGDYAVDMWRQYKEQTPNDIVEKLSPDSANIISTKVKNILSDKLYNAATNMDIGGIVATEGKKVIDSKKASLGMLAMMISDNLIDSLCAKLGSGVNDYIRDNGHRLIYDAVDKEYEGVFASPISQTIKDMDEQKIRALAIKVYSSAIDGVAAAVVKSVDIAGIVEKKIDAMDVKDLEKLVLSVMKKQLNAIVNLGAVIGCILGIIMCFI
jgi:uncharacterized membrane protein YheB (UPF0754 family)